MSAPKQSFDAELMALRPTRQSRIGLRTEGGF
jgi:hypothetical protein